MISYYIKEQDLVKVNEIKKNLMIKYGNIMRISSRITLTLVLYITFEYSTKAKETYICYSKYLFICYNTLEMGLQFCRPILSFDSIHPKSKYRGIHFFHLYN